MNADIFTALCDYLTEEVPEFRWIDEDSGQLGAAKEERPAVCFPCCLIDIQYASCRDLTDTEQVVKVTLTLKMAFYAWGDTNSLAPKEARAKALERLRTVEKAHAALQGGTDGGSVSPLCRLSARPSTMASGLKVYTVTYETTFEEYA